MNVGRLRGFLVLGEQKIFHEITQIVTIASQANEIIVGMIGEVTLERVTAETQNLKTLEEESDRAAFSTKRDIMNGAVNPTVLGDMLQSVDVADSIVDDYYYLAREISRMIRVQTAANQSRKSIFDTDFLNLLTLVKQSLTKLQRILQAGDIAAVREERRDIESLEQKGDEVKDASFDKLYSVASETGFLLFTHYSLVLHKLDDTLDSCEDLSDLILSIMVSISK